MNINILLEKRDSLDKQRATMLEYLKLRLALDDMHGVQDAARDIREIDAQLQCLYFLVRHLKVSCIS